MLRLMMQKRSRLSHCIVQLPIEQRSRPCHCMVRLMMEQRSRPSFPIYCILPELLHPVVSDGTEELAELLHTSIASGGGRLAEMLHVPAADLAWTSAEVSAFSLFAIANGARKSAKSVALLLFVGADQAENSAVLF